METIEEIEEIEDDEELIDIKFNQKEMLLIELSVKTIIERFKSFLKCEGNTEEQSRCYVGTIDTCDSIINKINSRYEVVIN